MAKNRARAGKLILTKIAISRIVPNLTGDARPRIFDELCSRSGGDDSFMSFARGAGSTRAKR